MDASSHIIEIWHRYSFQDINRLWFFLSHGFGTIVNPTTIIGNNVNLSQYSTIGSNEGKAAIIGNNVYIGPGVYIVEHVKIGSNVCIGAGAVVTKDIPMVRRQQEFLQRLLVKIDMPTIF